jgi:AAA+ ATPase superfamily predicted ATPase
MSFHGRKRELQLLDELYKRPDGQLAVIYGRRGVGKTALIEQWLAQYKLRALFWTADQRSSSALRRSFSQALQSYLDPSQAVEPDFTYASWDQVFSEVARLTEHQHLILVLDEFTYLIAADRALPSILQRVWDHQLKKRNLLLILTGSHAGMIERDVLSYRAPLYHRARLALHLQPLPYGALAEFLPNYTPADRVTIYACVGGVPQYLELLEADRTVAENIQALLGSRLVIDDAGALLRDQLSEPKEYVSIVEAISAGFNTVTDIARMVGLERTALPRYLGTLRKLGIVTREVPATETHPEKSRQGRYVIIDHYLRWYYAFLANQRANLERGNVQAVWALIARRLPAFVGEYVFEELCREYLWQLGNAGRLAFMPRMVGSYWGGKGQPQIDVVAINEDAHQIILGECKWQDKPLTAAIVADAISRAQKVIPGPAEKWTVSYAFFAKNGFALDARAAAKGVSSVWVPLERLDAVLQDLA